MESIERPIGKHAHPHAHYIESVAKTERTIVFRTERADVTEHHLAFDTTGTMKTAEGRIVGTCCFTVYRRKFNRRWLDCDEILSALDHRAATGQIGQALAYHDEYALEVDFNVGGLLIADRIHIEHEFRGRSDWKRLYFATMAEALSSLKRKPEEYYFKVFPLPFEGCCTPENRREFESARRDLRLLYAIHLSATCMQSPHLNGLFMKAPVPTNLLALS